MFGRKKPANTAAPTASPAPASGPAISLEKITSTAPKLVPLYKDAGAVLEQKGLTGLRAAVYLVLDRSGSMSRYYNDGSCQHLAEQVLAVAAHLDDDGMVPLVFFDNEAHPAQSINLANYGGRVGKLHERLGWMGSTDYAAAVDAVVEHYDKTRPSVPAFVVFQTDGNPDSRSAAERALRAASKRPIFWQFIGFGRGGLDFLERLDTLDGRAVDNAGFFPAGDNPRAMSDGELYRALMSEFPQWLTAARAAGITA